MSSLRPVKINKTVIQLQKVIIKFHTRLITNDGPCHIDSRFNETDYAIANYPSYITIEIMQGKDGVWLPSNSIILTDRNIYSVIQVFETILRNIYNNDIFATKNGSIIIYEDEAKKNTITLNIPFSKGVIMFIPAVIYDDTGVSYEGANIYLNNTANGTGLTIDALEAILYSLKKVDFFTYNQTLVNYYHQYYKCDIDDPVVRSGTKHDRKTVDWSGPTTTSNFKKEKSEDEFNKLISG